MSCNDTTAKINQILELQKLVLRSVYRNYVELHLGRVDNYGDIGLVGRIAVWKLFR